VLRDLREDAAVGRCYVPRDWLDECGVQPEWLRGDGPDAVYGAAGPVASLCRRLHAAAAARFAETHAALACMSQRQRRRLLPARVMGAVYAELLARLDARGGDLRQERVRLSRARKLWLGLRAALFPCGT
jgi:phytoene synthase